MAKGKADQWLTEDGLAKLRAWAGEGLSNAALARDKLGVSAVTLCSWKNRYPRIREALESEGERADRGMEDALYKLGTGYFYEEVTWERVVDRETGEADMVETRRVRKHVPASQSAQAYWLKNRKRGVWRDAPDKADIDLERLALDKRKADAETGKGAAQLAFTFSVEDGTASVEEVMA